MRKCEKARDEGLWHSRPRLCFGCLGRADSRGRLCHMASCAPSRKREEIDASEWRAFDGKNQRRLLDAENLVGIHRAKGRKLRRLNRGQSHDKHRLRISK